jgi:hypothetical protein
LKDMECPQTHSYIGRDFRMRMNMDGKTDERTVEPDRQVDWCTLTPNKEINELRDGPHRQTFP